MDYEAITCYLVDKGYNAQLENDGESRHLSVSIDVGGITIELIHREVSEFTCLPSFSLKNSADFGALAHVLTIDGLGFGQICVGDRDSVSVNYEQPHLALEESLKRHIELIRRGICDSNWNREELVREFNANWNFILKKSDPALILAAKEQHLELMQVFSPNQGRSYGYGSYYLGITDHASELSEFTNIAPTDTTKRTVVGEGFVIPLGDLNPPPTTRDTLGSWFLDAISALSSSELPALEKLVSRRRARQFWVVFNGNTSSGTAWFGIHLTPKGKGKRTLPIRSRMLDDWTIKPIRVTVFNKERVLPRGGADTSLSDKSVLLVGCGSVGGEIAYKLASSGIGKMILVDPDVFTLNNLYRHVLDEWLIGAGKAFALSMRIEAKHPWTKCKHHQSNLLSLRNKAILESFDLIIVAIGAPTHERIFHDFLVENKVSVSVINTWVEGYGIGGHATLDMPHTKGCLRCAYVDQETLGRGLASNLNFLEPGQDATVNHAGCGDLFLPYGAINAAQTAIIASDLAIHFLNGGISKSCKVSWKGDDVDALNAGLKTTHRYTMFKNSLARLPLYDEHCDICND